ncbi:MAG: hypothetical protein EBR82_34005 [Caulobacteraceae bacterium]|nr:hypothetical protein [Caulobacteraceae bacterium]
MTLADDVNKSEREEELQRTVRSLEQRLMREKSRTGELVNAVYRAARDAAMVHPPIPPIAKPSRDRRQRSGEEIALLHATDWQVGKRTESYDSDTAQQRLALFAEKAIKITDLHRAARPIRRAVLFLGGDMVEGVGIFPGQAYEIDATLYGQLFRVASMIQTLVTRLLETFDKVEVWEVAGNHGRLGRKGEMPGGDNIDRMAYAIARDRFTLEKRLTWHPATGWHQLAEVGNYRALLVHGDQIRSFGGNTPAFGILRKVTAWASGVTGTFHDAYMGHFHTPMTLTLPNGNRVYMTGSPESDNQYAAEFVAARGHPSQRLNFIDPERGRVSAEYHVYLDGES